MWSADFSLTDGPWFSLRVDNAEKVKNILQMLFQILFILTLVNVAVTRLPCNANETATNEVRSDQWQGFWLGQSIGNWTGLITEMDKIGGQGQYGQFYTRDDWGKPDQPNIWSERPSDVSSHIDFVLRGPDEIWGADDDTDVEYMYLWTMYQQQTAKLTPTQIREAWVRHIYDELQPTPYGKDEFGYQNFLWVSNQSAHTLMLKGYLPPETAHPDNNPNGDMIDAQLTTEIFGLLAPGVPKVALEIAYLPVRTAGYGDAVLISEFYIVMHSLAALEPRGDLAPERLQNLAHAARQYLPDNSVPASMFDFVKRQHAAGFTWEETRDALYQRYQVEQQDGYDVTSRDLHCNGCFASGINFAAILVSLFYGQGDLKETLKIAVLAGWDSDNPAATWGGLLGYILGREMIENQFDQQLSGRFNIHRTRRGFPNEGIDSFSNMARMAIEVSERVNVEYRVQKPD